MKLLKRIIPFVYVLLILLIAYNIYLSAVPVINNEVNFFNDVARDFLLLEELDEKKIVLIGPRSSTQGLFHGPLLTYIDYPAWLIGGGNPVTVAWFWVCLGITAVIGSFFAAKKLFGEKIGPIIGLTYALLLSTRMIPHINSVFEPEAMFFVMPFFLFTIIFYQRSKNWIYLFAHFVTVAVFVQLSSGIGIQFLFLSAAASLFIVYKNKKWKHLTSILAVPLFTINFILFDAKNNFMMAKAIMSTGAGSTYFTTVSSWIQNRIENTYSLQIFEPGVGHADLQILIFLFVVIFSIIQIRESKEDRPFYLILIYYYFGYITLSYFNKGIFLFHYIYLLVPLTLLWLVSFLNTKYKYLFISIIALVFLINFNYSNSYINGVKNSIGKKADSWVALSRGPVEIAKRQNGREFGYFVFSPDSFAYQQRYAAIYNFKASGAKAYEYVKKPTTYVIAHPPPPDDKYMDYSWWVKVPVGISAAPVYTKIFPAGHTIVEYNLNTEEQKVPHDKSIELGIHFR